MTAEGLVGVRRQSAELVPTQQRQWRLPAISIPWWDSDSSAVRHAVLPARDIEVLPGEVPFRFGSGGNVTGETPSGHSTRWQIAAIIAGLGWLLTLAWALYLKRPGPGSSGRRGREMCPLTGLVVVQQNAVHVNMD